MPLIFRFLGIFLFLGGEAYAETGVPNVEGYFPDQVGFSWSYEGSVADQVQRISTYTNAVTVSGERERHGVRVKVFSETNQANKGPAEGYFLRDTRGILFYGGEPSTLFERQIIPYRVIQFPMAYHRTYSQIKKRGIRFEDMDEDGLEETANVEAHLTVEDPERVMVPAGLFLDCLKLQGTMTVYLTLSRTKKEVEIIDKTSHWFAPGVGLIKWIEKINFPEVNGKMAMGVVIMEELKEYVATESSTQ